MTALTVDCGAMRAMWVDGMVQPTPHGAAAADGARADCMPDPAMPECCALSQTACSLAGPYMGGARP